MDAFNAPLGNRSGRNVTILTIFLAILLHLLVLSAPWHQLLWNTDSHLPKIEIAPINPSALKAIKQQWNQQLLLGRDQQHISNEAPDQARYFSDHNRKVEREQRAKNTANIPVPGEIQSRPNQPKSEPKILGKTRLRLSQLGIPFASKSRSVPAEPESHSSPSQVQRIFQDQWINDPSLTQGAENLLNSSESIYYSFYARLHQAIAPVWENEVQQFLRGTHLTQGSYITEVDAVLDSQGQIFNINLLRSSGIPELDQAAISAWRIVKNFPNPPQALLSRDGYVHIPYGFQVDTDVQTFGFSVDRIY